MENSGKSHRLTKHINGIMRSMSLQKTIIIIFLAIILIVGLNLFVFSKFAGKLEEKITYTNSSTDLIVVELPYPGAVVGKDFSVIGKARGTWYFEASFPVLVLDKNGKTLAAVPAQAQSDWMTENFVPFKVDIKITEAYIGPATLVLKKDNPSGLPEHDASISFPITIEY
jgi:hypothetical protein